MNKSDSETKWIFIAISIITSITAAIGSYMSLMVYRKKSKNLRDKQRKIVDELQKYKQEIDEYVTNDRQETLLKKVNEILRRD